MIASLGLAAALAEKEAPTRAARCHAYRDEVIRGLAPLNLRLHGDLARIVPHTLNVSFPGLDSEAVIVAVKDLIAISNGSACTSQSYEPSHVLASIALPDKQISGAVRLSWCHMTEAVDWDRVCERISALR